ncbi:CLIP domain-containing serine protease 2 isoform X1 [Pieris rapae]|uniref:CLIP domain-containing serine protease 2 isoform X1 n=1 Tax=Pieris rapae TaxID=64459 RepID=UPI001E27C437|nr:CLIP domain-containing serine protease 2 isoform X1 [Pieris rapae]
MFVNIFLGLLVLHSCYLVYSERYCSDCQIYYTCKAAADHARFKPGDETNKLFEKAACGTETEDEDSDFKVCCSDIPSLNTSPQSTPPTENYIESRWAGIDQETLLPDRCGSIWGNRIIGGRKANLFDFPWMVLIAHETREDPQFQCGGTIINSKYILTAAHCVVDKKIAFVRIGEFDINLEKDCDYEKPKTICKKEVQDIYVTEIIPHENYQRSPIANDIALLRVDGEIVFNYPNVEPICLPLSLELRNKRLDHEYGTVAGWGFTETGRESGVLLRVEVPVKTEAECEGFYNRNNQDAVKKQFCAGELKKDSCNGDSGGPLMMKANYNGVNSYVQYGIVSHGPIQCGTLFPGVYTDVREYVDWILDNIKE